MAAIADAWLYGMAVPSVGSDASAGRSAEIQLSPTSAIATRHRGRSAERVATLPIGRRMRAPLINIDFPTPVPSSNRSDESLPRRRFR